MNGQVDGSLTQAGFRADGIEAITFDFGNTLVPFADGQFGETMRRFAVSVHALDGRIDAANLIAIWAEERDRQIREDVPRGLETELPTRAVRVLARLRGCPAPDAEARWVVEEAARYSTPDEIERVLDAYVEAFVATTPVPPEIDPMLERLAARYRLGVVSNWPLTASIERFLDAAGWTRHLGAVVVSHTVGCIKPWPGIFLAAAEGLGVDSGRAILHVGDDLAADVGGAQALGWRTAWIERRPKDSPLPVATVNREIRPDLTLGSVLDLEAALASGKP